MYVKHGIFVFALFKKGKVFWRVNMLYLLLDLPELGNLLLYRVFVD